MGTLAWLDLEPLVARPRGTTWPTHPEDVTQPEVSPMFAALEHLAVLTNLAERLRAALHVTS